MAHRHYPYPIPDDPGELARQLEILITRRTHLERMWRLDSTLRPLLPGIAALSLAGFDAQ